MYMPHSLNNKMNEKLEKILFVAHKWSNFWKSLLFYAKSCVVDTLKLDVYNVQCDAEGSLYVLIQLLFQFIR